MAFDPENFHPELFLSSYLSTTDTMVEITETDYFSLAPYMALGNMIIIKSSDGDGGIYKVTQASGMVTIAKI